MARRSNPFFKIRRRGHRRRNPDGVSAGLTGLRGPLGILPSMGQAKGIVQTALGFGAARLVANFVHNAVLSRLPIPGGNLAAAALKILSHGIGWSLASRLGGRAVGGGFSAGAAASFAVGSAQALFGVGGALPLPIIGPLLSDYETIPAMTGPIFPGIDSGGGVEDYETVADLSGIDSMTGERTW